MNPIELEAFDRERERILRAAMTAADRVILTECRGDPEVLALLTAEVAKAFAEKVVLMLRQTVYQKGLQRKEMPWEMEDGTLEWEDEQGVSWVVFDGNTGLVTCQRCKETLNMRLPQPISVFAAAGEAFRKLHEGCRETVDSEQGTVDNKQ